MRPRSARPAGTRSVGIRSYQARPSPGSRLHHRQLQARDRSQPGLLRRPRKLHRPEHPVVIRQRQRRMPLLPRLPHQLLNRRSPLQQRVVRMRMQLHIRHRIQHRDRHHIRRLPRRQRPRRVVLHLRINLSPLRRERLPPPGRMLGTMVRTEVIVRLTPRPEARHARTTKNSSRDPNPGQRPGEGGVWGVSPTGIRGGWAG